MAHQAKTILIVLDGVGVGEAPDAAAYGDQGSDSIGNTAKRRGHLHLPNMARLGLGHLTDIQGTPPHPHPVGVYGKIAELSAGKDSTTGHWEMCGIVTEQAFPTYPEGFPVEVIDVFGEAIGHQILGNKACSGTLIIEELGDRHRQNGDPIVYTSADSVFQIAAHEQVVPIDQLYEWCEIARRQLDGKHRVGRVIARPFTGESGAYRRTLRRRDYTVQPPTPSMLDLISGGGNAVVGIGKIEDLFSKMGLTDIDHATSNVTGMKATLDWYRKTPPGALIFVNLNDFDTLWGHRNDVEGYAQGLEQFDAWLPSLLSELKGEDLLLITSDHGNDPTTPGTDHSREYLPLLGCMGGHPRGSPLGVVEGLTSIAATILEHYGRPERMNGSSFRQHFGAQ